jgi:hypothetical protein
MNKGKCFSFAVILAMAPMAQADLITDPLPGNLFAQTGAPLDPNVSIAIDGPSNRGGGFDPSGGNYPVGGNSPVSTGNFYGGTELNFAMTKGSFASNKTNFNAVPYGVEIGTIRIWAENFINQDGSTWEALPQQVAVAYSTQTYFDNTIGNGGSYNTSTLGTLPSWVTQTPILGVNGDAPTEATSYGTGWADLSSSWNMVIQPVPQQVSGLGYVDLTVDIPADATSVLISLGGDPEPGGDAIADVQAIAVPEPATIGVLGIAGAGLLVRRRRSNSK